MIYLTDEEAEKQRKKYGENVLTKRKKKSFFARYLEAFDDPIVKILLVALAINLIFLCGGASVTETIGVAVSVFLSTLVSTLSSYGSAAAFERLQEAAAQGFCKVGRNGEIRVIPSSELVVGDVVFLEAGEKICADGVLLSGSLRVNQSALSGESAETEKTPESLGEGLFRKNALFKSSLVAAGEGVMRVTAVGDSTFYGRLAFDAQEESPESPLKTKLKRLAQTISKIGYVAAAFVAAADLFNSIVLRHADVLPSIMHALTLAVALVVVAVPEGLPMMIAVVLSANVGKLQKEGVLVRNSEGIEAAGCVNILFTDKTGTLTNGTLRVEKYIDGNGQVRDEPVGTIKKALCLSARFDTSCKLGKRGEVLGGNATERALFFAGDTQEDVKAVSRLPFDSARKFSAACVELNGKEVTFLKGAPERILPCCKTALAEDGTVFPLSKRKAELAAERLADGSFRVIAIMLAEGACVSGSLPENGILLSLVALSDEVRADVPAAMAEANGAGVQVVMITGDNLSTAIAVAKKSGILSSGESAAFPVAVTGEELAKLTDDELKAILRKLKVVARALPADKSRVVRLSQEIGLVAGMTGDGVNDAPALKRADVGFAMGSGTEVAKEAGDIVLTKDDFASVVKTIRYGRTLFKSIRKFVVFQLTMNFCAVGVSIVAPFIGIGTPVTVAQMLWINVVMDTLAGLAFAGEPPLASYMRERPLARTEPVIDAASAKKIGWTSAYTVALCLWFLKASITARFFSGESFFTAFFGLFVFSGLFNAFHARTDALRLKGAGKAFSVFIGAVAIAQTLLMYFGRTAFRTSPLSASRFFVVILLSSSVLPFGFLRKLSLKKKLRADVAKRRKISYKSVVARERK